MRALIFFAASIAAVGCGSDTPVPEYPFPPQAPLEETDLAQYVVDDEGVGDEEEEEEWDDGLSDEDLQMGSGEDAPEPAEESGDDADSDG